VGYNRRFSPHARAVRAAFENRRGPLAIHYVVAAGATPGGTWHVDPNVGGGRVVGECGHFIDLCSYLANGLPISVYARALGRDPETDDSILAMLNFADGSTATLAYLANASSELPKERWEVSSEGRTAICENFRNTRILGGKTVKTMNQDKGQATAVSEVVEAVRSGNPSPFALETIVAVSRATFAVHESIRTGQAVEIASGW
jgi:predicted dehydrogenase